MIISSTFAFFAFVLLVLPGFAYTLVRAKFKPARKESVLQETSRILASSLGANTAVLLILNVWWMPPLRTLINGSATDIFQAYIDVTIRLLVVAAASCLIAYCGGFAYHRLKDGKPSQTPVSVFDDLFTMPSQDIISTSFITLNDDTQIWGRVVRYDNAPESDPRFIRVASPYWIGNLSDNRGRISTDADMVIATNSVRIVENGTHSVEDAIGVDKIAENFPTDN